MTLTQKDHLAKARKAKLDKAKQRRMEELARMTEDDDDDDFRQQLLKKAKEITTRKFPKIVEEEEPKPSKNIPDKDELTTLKEEVAELKKALESKTEPPKKKEEETEDKTDDNDVEDDSNNNEDGLGEEIDDLQEDMEDMIEDRLDEDGIEIFNLLNKLHELEIKKIRDEYEEQIDKIQHEENKRAVFLESIKRNIQDKAQSIFRDQIIHDKGIQSKIDHDLQSYIQYFPECSQKDLEKWKEQRINYYISQK